MSTLEERVVTDHKLEIVAAAGPDQWAKEAAKRKRERPA